MARPGLDFNAERRAVLGNHVKGTLALADDVKSGRLPAPDVVLWPENSSDIDPTRDSQAAAEITTLVPSGSVDVRLRGRDAEFVVDVPPPTAQFSTPGPEDAVDASDLPEGETDSDVVRITVRIPESVKVRAEELAAKSGRSLNA